MTHAGYEENVGAYLLGALPELERQAFERHIERCGDCRSEVERLRPAVEALPRAATPLTPPPRLKTALMQVVEREAGARALPASEEAPAPPRRPARRARLTGLLTPRPRLRPTAAWATAGLLLAVGAAAGFALAEELGDGGSQRLTAQVDERRLPRASARLVVAEDGRTAVLQTNAMPVLKKGSVYQVWLQRDGEVIPQSLFQVGPGGQGAGAVTDALEGAAAVMVTREPAGGSRAPTEKPVLAVEL
jgi:anti-sigma-K factor RskA